MPDDAAYRKLVNPRQDSSDWETDDHENDQDCHRIVRDRQPIERDIGDWQQHSRHDRIRDQRPDYAAAAKFFDQILEAALHALRAFRSSPKVADHGPKLRGLLLLFANLIKP
ncbi:MAG: hypothetical protein OEM85_16620 [Gammaproteobacteria bacterium]|nr:hypothetical protein [Gammaproteobacteria bacterium]